MTMRVSVTLPDDLAYMVDAAATRTFTTRPSVIRRAVAHWYACTHNNDGQPAEDDWKPYGQPRTVGAGIVTSLRSRTSTEWGHLIETTDGHIIRVLPDGQTTGKKRSHTITEALTDAAEQCSGGLTADVLIGRLVRAGISRHTIHAVPDEAGVSG